MADVKKEKEVIPLNLDEFIKSLDSIAGKGNTHHGDQLVAYTDVIPFSSINLNNASGIGGLPKGKIIEILGWESAGKAQPLDSNVLTPNGWVNMQYLNVGDNIMCQNGDVAPIAGIFPQGIREVYKITFSDGTIAESCKEHLWQVCTKSDNEVDRWDIKSLEEIMKDYKLPTRFKYRIPLNECLKFDKKVLKLDPYLMGCLLGDGSFIENTIKYSSCDQELINNINKILLLNNPDCKIEKITGTKYDYSISKKIKGHKLSSVSEIIKFYELNGLKSNNKFIPKDYIYSSKEDRIALLQGILDTDGSTTYNSAIELCMTSKEIIESVEFLVRSLGGKVWRSNKLTTYTYKDEKKSGLPAYRLSILLPKDIQPFRLNRKLKEYKGESNFLQKMDSKYRKSRKTETQCIFVDHPDHLYITDGFNVTHNTTISTDIMANAMQFFNDDCLLIDRENAYDPFYAKTLGCDTTKIIVTRPDSLEDNYSVIERALKSKLFGVIICDSLTSFAPQGSIDGNQAMGKESRINSAKLRDVTRLIEKSNTLVIFINQIREKIGVMFGNPETTNGGNALKFYAHMRIMIRKVEVKDGYNTMQFKFIKNKLAPPMVESKIKIVWGKGFDLDGEAIDLAIQSDILLRKGNSYIYKEEIIATSRPKLDEYLAANPDVIATIKDLVKNVKEHIKLGEEDVSLSDQLSDEEKTEHFE